MKVEVNVDETQFHVGDNTPEIQHTQIQEVAQNIINRFCSTEYFSQEELAAISEGEF